MGHGVKVMGTMQSSLKADAEVKAVRDAINWAKKLTAAVALVLIAALGLVVGVTIDGQQHNAARLQQIDQTVTQHNSILTETLQAACVLLEADPRLSSIVPKDCPPLTPAERAAIAAAQS